MVEAAACVAAGGICKTVGEAIVAAEGCVAAPGEMAQLLPVFEQTRCSA